MSYTVFKNNNKSITAPNESGEIVLDTSISRQIRIDVDRNKYKFYDIVEKKYLDLSEIGDIDLERCFFTASIYPCGKNFSSSLAANEANYPILYKFINSCLGSTFTDYPLAAFNGKYCLSNNIYFTGNNDITIEFEFPYAINAKTRLKLSPNGLGTANEFYLTSNDIEIISLFQHNITINARLDISNRINTRYLYSFSFSFINNRYEQYDKSGLTTQNRLLSMIEDLPQNKRYPASGLLYLGSYSGGSSTMSMLVCYTINYVNKSGSNLNVHALDTDMNMNAAPTSIINIDDITQTIVPHGMTTLTFVDDVIKLS